YRSFLTGVSNTRPISYAAGMSALLNLLFNYLLVFGKMGFPRMEIEGAACASVLSEAISLIYLILWVRQKELGKEFSCFQFAKPIYSEIRSILKIAFPVMIQHVLSLASWLTFFLVIEGIGERPLAVSNVIRSVYSILMIPLIGLSQATQTLVSKVIGEGGAEIVNILIKRLMIVSMLSSIVMVALNLINPTLAVSIFTNDASLIQDSMAIIPIISVSIIIFATATVLLSVVSGSGNTIVTMMIEMSTLAIYLTYTLVAVKKFHVSLPVVWTSEFVYFICITLFAGGYLYTGEWKNTKVYD
ncbi:MATE family efflux transporter, partial [Flavobacteriales bacterium]|nr:MATE family efflux transporter [Flavobacteriales bacterium]